MTGLDQAFPDDSLRALNNWQNGWREDQERRAELAAALVTHVKAFDSRFRTVSRPCFRKRFVLRGELVSLLLNNRLEEGVTSWTSDLRFAERFKGRSRPGAISAAIYCHIPTPDEVVLNVGELWQSPDFVAAAESFRARHVDEARALFQVRDLQSEVILNAPLRGSEIIALSGASSPFDELCDYEGIPEDGRDAMFRRLVDEGVYPQELHYTYLAPDIIARTIRAFAERVEALKRTGSPSA